MPKSKRVFIFGAGFSRPAGMPLATELLPLLSAELELDEMREWLGGMGNRLAWLSGEDQEPGSFALNIEQVFHYARFDVEVYRLLQHLVPVGRGDGPDTPWNQAESIQTWLSYLEDSLRDVILEHDRRSDLGPIDRWARAVTEHDSVLTFNYDTLVERSLSSAGRAWNHGTGGDGDRGIAVFKLHGSIDWIVAHRSQSFAECDLLFDKKNENRGDGKTGSIEDDRRLWRCRSPDQLRNWIEDRDLQPHSTGIAGLGAYKELHQIPGLGVIWTRALQALCHADLGIIVGFSMSDFDAMAQMQFAEVARRRCADGRPLRVLIIDPFLGKAAKTRFRRVFRSVCFLEKKHEELDWVHLK